MRTPLALLCLLTALYCASCRTPNRNRGTQSESDPVLKWVAIDGADSIAVETCNLYRVIPKTDNGQPLAKELPVDVRVDDSVRLYRDDLCTQGLDSFEISSGNADAKFYLKPFRGRVLTLVVQPRGFPSAAMEIEVLAASDLSLVPGSVDLPSQAVGSTQFLSLTLRNRGKGTARELHLVSPLDPFFFAGGQYPGVGGTCGAELKDGETCTFSLAVTPEDVGPFEADFTLAFRDDYTSASLFVRLQGEATP